MFFENFQEKIYTTKNEPRPEQEHYYIHIYRTLFLQNVHFSVLKNETQTPWSKLQAVVDLTYLLIYLLKRYPSKNETVPKQSFNFVIKRSTILKHL